MRLIKSKLFLLTLIINRSSFLQKVQKWYKVNFISIFKAANLLSPMASAKKKKKITAVDSDSQEEDPRKNFSEETIATRNNEKYTTHASEEI